PQADARISRQNGYEERPPGLETPSCEGPQTTDGLERINTDPVNGRLSSRRADSSESRVSAGVRAGNEDPQPLLHRVHPAQRTADWAAGYRGDTETRRRRSAQPSQTTDSRGFSP